MTEAKTKGFCKEVGIDIGYFNGILHRSCKEASKCLYLYKSHFSVICERESVSLMKATAEVKKNIKLQAACLNYHIVNTYEK